MCLYKRVFEFGPDSGAPCPITMHMDCRLTQLRQTIGEVTATFSNGRTATGEVLVGADGINSATLQLAWPNPRPKRWTEVTCFRGLVPRAAVASLRKADGSPLDNNPIDSFSMDRHRNDRSGATTYWVRGGELLNVWIAHYEPDLPRSSRRRATGFPSGGRRSCARWARPSTGSASREDLLALAGAIVRPTKWGLYDRDALETWVQGRICLLGDAAHPMLPTFGQGAAQSFEDAAALASAFALHKRDVATAMLHYERVRHYRATRFQLGSKFAFDHLRAKDTAEQKALLETLDERVSPPLPTTSAAARTTPGSTRTTPARSAPNCLTRDWGRGTSAGPPRPTTPRSPASSGCQLLPPRVHAPSRAKRSPCTTRETIAGSSSRGKFTTYRVGTPSSWWRWNRPNVRRQGSHGRIR